tara:strand:- start:113 stop:517 length:405 start_codon:yes stop_codon:yes gene_type:complete
MKRTNRWKGWTPKEVEQVDFLVRGGASVKEIAEQMDGRTEGAIYYIIYRKRHIYLSWRSRQKVRAFRRREDRKANGRIKEAKEDKAPVTSDLSEIASVADNNRIRLGMSDMAIVVGAMCSFATLVLLSLVVAFA